MKRLPVLPTVLVGLAVAAMVALGVWQLSRLSQKEALLVRYAANLRLPATAFPEPPIGEALLFRKAGAMCLVPTGWHSEAGRDAAGRVGWRVIVRCATGAEGPGFQAQLGVARDPNAHPAWKGGVLHGYIAHAPQHRPLIAQAFGRATPPELMLVASDPPAGLAANAGPDLSAVPNNHLAYAVQWFLFAAVAVVVYAVAVRQRLR